MKELRMSGTSDYEPITGTVLDPDMAPRRLKEGLVPDGTGIFLRIEEGPDSGTVLELSSGGVYLIGRGGADIKLQDDKISRRHAEIGLYGPDAYVLRDLASTNGTRLNGIRVEEKARLQHGDLISIGDTRLRLSVLEDSIPLS
jgi:pSer/pThr/pTyr-binding forkhead associated (FHA) protein